METKDIIELILRGRETRSVEMKQSMDFSQVRTKAKAAKAAMGMANIRDGGIIIWGMKKVNDHHVPEGMEEAHIGGFNQDQVSSATSEYAAPYVELTVTSLVPQDVPQLAGKTFVIIEVREFAEIPVICKKQYGPENLRKGGIYIRSLDRHETREVQTEAEMRELMDLATLERLRRHLRITEAAGGRIVPSGKPDDERFEEQAGL